RPKPRPQGRQETSLPYPSLFDPFLLALADNMDAGGRVKMRAENQRVAIAMLVDELGPCPNGKVFINISLLAPLRFSDLYRMHHHIAGDHGFLAIRAQEDAAVTWRMAGGRDKGNLIVDAPGALHPLDLSRLNNRHDILLDYGLILRICFVPPMLPLTLVEQIGGVGKRRRPAPVPQAGIPTRVVEMHVGTKYVIDRFRSAPGGSKVAQVRALTAVPLGEGEIPFIVADTGIDQDRMMFRANKKRVDAQQHAFLGVHKAGLQPIQVRIKVFLALIDVEEAWAGGLQAIQHLCQLDVPDSEGLD